MIMRVMSIAWIARGSIIFALALGIIIGLCFCTTSSFIGQREISSVIITENDHGIALLQRGETVYTDRVEQTIADIPEIFLHGTIVLVKFPNDDKGFTGELYAFMELLYDAHVFIAYDSRGTVPEWLEFAFDSTGIQIPVTDPGQDTLMYNLYYTELEATSYVLGGNMAPPAEGAGSNYFILIDFSDTFDFMTELNGYILRFYQIEEEPDSVSLVAQDGVIDFMWEPPIQRLPFELQEVWEPVGTRIDLADSSVFSSSPEIYTDSTGTYSWNVTLPPGYYEATLIAVDTEMQRSQESNGLLFGIPPDSVKAPPNLPLRFRKN